MLLTLKPFLHYLSLVSDRWIPCKRTVILSYSAFFVVGLNKLLNKIWNCRSLETPRLSCDTIFMVLWLISEHMLHFTFEKYKNRWCPFSFPKLRQYLMPFSGQWLLDSWLRPDWWMIKHRKYHSVKKISDPIAAGKVFSVILSVRIGRMRCVRVTSVKRTI